VQKEWAVQLDGEACFVRQDGAGQVQRLALCRGRRMSVGEVVLQLKGDTEFIEVAFDQGRAAVVSGNPEDVQSIRLHGQEVGASGGQDGRAVARPAACGQHL
jgi:hypothetical protein